jgi:hypothetical protein
MQFPKTLAGETGLEPAASCVTGRRSNQLSYVPKAVFYNLEYVSHRTKRFVASLGSTISLLWVQFRAYLDTKPDTKTTNATTR